VASNRKHSGDAQLRVLLSGDETSDEYRTAAAHVEHCEACRKRLDDVAGPAEIEVEARQLLGGYPWEDLSEIQPSGHSTDAVCDTPPNLDFLSPPSHPEMLGRLGRYEIERVIGSGGMGIVLKAFDTELNRSVAIKVLAEYLAHRGAARKRFTREAKAAAAVVNEHVVAIHNVEAERDLPFLVMQYVAGESLQARVDRDGPLDAKEILRIGIQAAAGLAAAHEQGVVHRDVKPANILLEHGVERVLLTDFGLARTVDDASLTHTGVVAGTPHYMSPEQAGGETTDHRTDLFSLGSVLYFVATGHPPFRAERAMGVLHRICHDTHRPAWQINCDIPDELSRIIDRLLAKKPSRRFASALEVKEAMARLLAKLQQRGTSRRNTMARLLRRPVAAVALCGLAVVVAVVAATFLPRTPAVRMEPSGSESAGATDPMIQSERVDTSIEALTADDAADSSDLEDIAERLGRLESMSDASTFARDSGEEFHRQTQSLDGLLDHLNGETFPDSPNLPQNGAR
jgi:serine/threonine protein kinase